LIDAEVGSDEAPGEAFCCVDALLSQHDSEVGFTGFMLLGPFR
jgi:hypothetical protein